jgi:hypothetical protein
VKVRMGRDRSLRHEVFIWSLWVSSAGIPRATADFLLFFQAVELRKWGADGVIVGSALVKVLGEANSPEEGLQEMTRVAKSIRAAI